MVRVKLVAMCWLGIVGALPFARADSLNTSGVICQAYNAANAKDIEYRVNGVSNRSTVARQIACAVPRARLPAGGTPAFYIDAYNNAGTCTSCMITMYHRTGEVAASQAVLRCAPPTASRAWTELVSFPTPAGDDYARVICTLPANTAGMIFGITALRPSV